MTQHWEYKTVNPSKTYAGVEILSEDPEDRLNALGEEGWELADTVEESTGKTKYLIFKRPK